MAGVRDAAVHNMTADDPGRQSVMVGQVGGLCCCGRCRQASADDARVDLESTRIASPPQVCQVLERHRGSIPPRPPVKRPTG